MPHKSRTTHAEHHHLRLTKVSETVCDKSIFQVRGYTFRVSKHKFVHSKLIANTSPFSVVPKIHEYVGAGWLNKTHLLKQTKFFN